ncbi:glucoside xylosyltransferase 1-like [Ixodes scapularis]
MEWPASALNRITYDLRLVMFPMKDFETWKKMFVPCATQRLFLPDMLPNEDAVLYVDADTLFVNPVEELWSVFEEMNESHLTALGHEIEDVGRNWYHQGSKTPFHPPFGANSGIMLMNLTRMRSFDWVSRLVPLMKEYAGRILLGDQDFINILFSAHPDKLLTFTCRWGYRQDNCKFHDSCSGETPALLHGNLKCFTAPFRSPAFSTIHRVMRKSLLREPVRDTQVKIHKAKTGAALNDDLLAELRANTLKKRHNWPPNDSEQEEPPSDPTPAKVTCNRCDTGARPTVQHLARLLGVEP